MNGFPLYDVPDFPLDPPECFCERHNEECGCVHCHEHQGHDWRQWSVFPQCESCEDEMYEWLVENVDEPLCAGCKTFRRICNDDVDRPLCVNCYSAVVDRTYESLKGGPNHEQRKSA